MPQRKVLADTANSTTSFIGGKSPHQMLFCKRITPSWTFCCSEKIALPHVPSVRPDHALGDKEFHKPATTSTSRYSQASLAVSVSLGAGARRGTPVQWLVYQRSQKRGVIYHVKFGLHLFVFYELRNTLSGDHLKRGVTRITLL